MSTIKNKLLQEINNKAQKKREKRVEAANNKTIQAAVFEFFKNVEESRILHNNERYDADLVAIAKRALENKLKSFDSKIKISIEWTSDEGTDSVIRGVTLWWSSLYIQRNNVNPSTYIDVSEMLLT